MNITNKDVVQYITYIKVNFPKAFVFTGTEKEIATQKRLLVNSWYDLLQGYSKEECDKAVKSAVMNFEYGDYPKISDIIKELKGNSSRNILNANKLWAEFLNKRGLIVNTSEKLIDVFRNGTDEEFKQARANLIKVFDELSTGLKMYFINWDNLSATANLSEQALQYEKNNFFRAFREQAEYPEREVLSKEYGALFDNNGTKRLS